MTEWVEENVDSFDKEAEAAKKQAKDLGWGEVEADRLELLRQAREHFKKIPDIPLNHPLSGVTD